MRRFFAFALLLAACSSSAPQQSRSKAKIPAPEIGIEQESGPADQGYPYGAFEVQYRVEIANRADIPVTLKRITVQTVNPAGGAYTLRSPFDYYFNRTIAPRTTETVEFWAKAYGYGRSMRDSEPVTLKGVAYFQTADGYVNQVFIRERGQMQ